MVVHQAFRIQYVNFWERDDPTTVAPTNSLCVARSGSPQLELY